MTSSKKKDGRLIDQYADQKKYERKMKAAGMKLIRIWVPGSEEERVKTFAAGLRKPYQMTVK